MSSAYIFWPLANKSKAMRIVPILTIYYLGALNFILLSLNGEWATPFSVEINVGIKAVITIFFSFFDSQRLFKQYCRFFKGSTNIVFLWYLQVQK